MARERTAGVRGREQLQSSVENLERRLDMLDRRLDDIDSMISAVIERVMNQPVNIGITCPNCGTSVDISIIGNKKPRP